MSRAKKIDPPESFIFYKSFAEAIAECPESEQLEIYRAITAYVFAGVEPELATSHERMAWKLIRPQLDANLRRYINGCQGGAPKGNQNARKVQRVEIEDVQVIPENPVQMAMRHVAEGMDNAARMKRRQEFLDALDN